MFLGSLPVLPLLLLSVPLGNPGEVPAARPTAVQRDRIQLVHFPSSAFRDSSPLSLRASAEEASPLKFHFYGFRAYGVRWEEGSRGPAARPFLQLDAFSSRGHLDRYGLLAWGGVDWKLDSGHAIRLGAGWRSLSLNGGEPLLGVTAFAAWSMSF